MSSGYRRRIKRRENKQRMNGFTEVKVYREPGDQSITIKDIFTLENLQNGNGGTGVFIKGYSITKPYAALQQSSYSGFLNTFDLMRLKKYNLRLYVPAATLSLGGLTASKLYRDARADNPNPFYEGLCQERLVRRGKMWTVYSWNWSPIEPNDWDFFPVSNALDNGRYGQINWAAIGVPAPYTASYVPLVEITYVIDFKYLKDPIVPTISTTASRDRHDSDDDSIVTINNLPRDAEVERLKSMVEYLTHQLSLLRP